MANRMMMHEMRLAADIDLGYLKSSLKDSQTYSINSSFHMLFDFSGMWDE